MINKKISMLFKTRIIGVKLARLSAAGKEVVLYLVARNTL
jgi:hypothetical protein